MPRLINKLSKQDGLELVAKEPFERVTISFYKYAKIENPQITRDQLFTEWKNLGILGRIYIAQEGINAQLSVPEHNVEAFRKNVDTHAFMTDVPFKIALQEEEISFWKLTIKVREQIVADDLPINSYDISNVGKHLSAKEWNEAMNSEDTIVVDMRNNYESDIGHFDGAVKPDVMTFREELPKVLDDLKGKEEKKILLYCTGGVRCEKTSAFLKHHGFEDVNQLHGGIIDYMRQVKQQALENKFIGKNFVFDGRREETITDDILTECYTCKKPANSYVDCTNTGCHVLFIQCEDCQQSTKTTCSAECKKIVELPIEEQRKIRKGRKAKFEIIRTPQKTA